MIIDALLLIILAICVITDLKNRKIYNNVIFPGLAAAFGIHIITGGLHGLGYAAAGFTAGLGLLLIPYLLGGMGAGDVKLLALVGAFKGAGFVLATSVYMALLGGLLALAILLFRKGMAKRLHWSLISLSSLRYGVKMPLTAYKDTLQTTYPYGVAIAGGAALCLWLKGWGLF